MIVKQDTIVQEVLTDKIVEQETIVQVQVEHNVKQDTLVREAFDQFVVRLSIHHHLAVFIADLLLILLY